MIFRYLWALPSLDFLTHKIWWVRAPCLLASASLTSRKARKQIKDMPFWRWQMGTQKRWKHPHFGASAKGSLRAWTHIQDCPRSRHAAQVCVHKMTSYSGTYCVSKFIPSQQSFRSYYGTFVLAIQPRFMGLFRALEEGRILPLTPFFHSLKIAKKLLF